MRKEPGRPSGDGRRDDILSRLFKHTGILVAGATVASLFGLASNVLAARRLGPSDYGFLALLTTYAFFVVGGFVTFQPWQALIHYGTRALTAGDRPGFKRLLKFGFLIDVAAGVAGMLLCGASVFVYGRLKGWDPRLLAIGTLYGAALLFRLTGTATAILRLFDRFDLIALQQVSASAVRLLCVGAAYIRGDGLRGFLLMWLVSEVLGYLIYFGLALVELRRRELGGILRAPLAGLGRDFPGLWKFVVTTNLHGTLKTAVRELDILVVGGVLGNAAAGLYKIARQFARVIGRLEESMRQAIYPDLSRLWAHRDESRFRKLFREPALLMGGLGAAGWVAFGLLGKPILRLTVGPPYVAAYGVTLVYFTGVVISMGTFHFQSVLMAMGRPQDVFKSMLGATSIYFVLLAGLTATLGLFGAALAYGIFEAIWGGWMGARIRRAFPRGNGTPLTTLGETPEGPPATPAEIPSDLEGAAS